MELENNTEQPTMDSNVTANQPNADNGDSVMNQTVTLSDGKEVSVEELTKGYMRQEDYTKKTQEVAKQKKSYSEEDTKAMELLKEAGFATLDDIKSFKHEQDVKEEYNTFKHSFNTLNDTQLKTVQALKQSNPNKSYEDIAQEFWIIDEVNLQRSKWSSIKGNNIGIPQQEKKEVFKMKGYNPNFKDAINKYGC